MMTSLFSAVAGLSTHQTKMDVIGDNLANVNTIGFKSSRVSFATGFSQLMKPAEGPLDGRGGSNAIEVGLGTRINSIDRVFEQGNFENTGSRNDLAIQGDGFFVLGDGERQFFSRAGNFQIDADGSLLAAGGRMHILGRLADQDGTLISSSAVEPLKLPFGEKDPARASTEISYFCNLDANSSKNQTYAASFAFNVDGVPATRNTELNSIAQTTADLDDGDVIRLTATKRDGTTVDLAFTYGAGNDGTTIGDMLDHFNSSLGFDSESDNGSRLTIDATGKLVLKDNLAGNSDTTISIKFEDLEGTNASALLVPTFVNTETGVTGSHSTSIYVYDSRGERHKVEVNFTQDTAQENTWNWEAVVDDGAVDEINNRLGGNFGTVRFNGDGSLLSFDGGPLTFTPPQAQALVVDLDAGTVGTFDGITQFSAPTTTIALHQDGHAMGVLSDFTVDNSGKIIGSYSNGVSRTLGQIALARFANPSGLTLAGENIYSATVNSGDPLIGVDTGNVNEIYSGYLELSTVDMAEQFTEMIIAQRGFQAASRVITVADQLLNEVTQLKR
ncbi:MAG: flagellar hook protein FlgE [Calditrichaeota bacterium]|nr:flagellar hook protein FlgE [Calditrichota bacterium]MCB9368817.1 flagellar hook protein FlgE [Calditrichota bacterium]